VKITTSRVFMCSPTSNLPACIFAAGRLTPLCYGGV
jgi:hypothetical protein